MAILFRRVSSTHRICQDVPPDDLTKWARKWWLHVGLDMLPSEYAILAFDNGVRIGFFRFILMNGSVDACGTWVEPRYRRQGIARHMWRLALKGHQHAKVLTTSPSGKGLVRALSKEHHACSFETRHNDP